MTFFLFHVAGFGGTVDATPVVVDLVDSESVDADGTTFTFSATNFGDEHSTRIIVAALSLRSAGNVTIDSVTIGGVSASADADIRNSSGGNTSRCAIYKASVPTGASGDIVVSTSGTALRVSCSTYRMINSLGVVPTGGAGTSTVADPTANINCSAGGAIIGVAYTQANTTATWTGITEDVEIDMDGTAAQSSSAHLEFSAAQVGLTVTCDWASSSLTAGAFVAYDPA